MSHRPTNIPHEIQDFMLKNSKAQGINFYWDMTSVIMIPTSLWESTKDLKH